MITRLGRGRLAHVFESAAHRDKAPKGAPLGGSADGSVGGVAVLSGFAPEPVRAAQRQLGLEPEPVGFCVLWDAVRAAELAAAVAYVAQLDAVLAIYDDDCRTYGHGGPLGDTVAEAGLVSHLSGCSLERRLEQALTVRAVPLLRTLLLAGRLGVPHAVAAADEVSDYGEEVATRVLEHVLLADEPGWQDTPTALVRALRRKVLRLDPEGWAERRAAREAVSTGIRLKTLADGLAKLTATGNALSVRAAHALLGRLAAPTGPDDGRTAGQRQLEALCDALVAAAHGAVTCELQLGIPVGPAAPRPAPPAGGALDPVVVTSDLTAELLDLLTGNTPPAPARASEPAAGGPDEAPWDEAQWDEAGLAAAEREAADREETDREQTELAETEPGRAGPAAVSPDEPPRRRDPRRGITEVEGVGPVDPGLLRELLDRHSHGLPAGLAGISVRRLCVDRTGQVISVDAVAVPLGRLLAAAAAPTVPPGRGRGPQPAPTAQQLLRALVSGLPEPPPDTAAYEPTAAQRRVVRARDRHCTFPGCRRPARTSQLDHRDPFPDGPTSTFNLHPLCKHHHDLKHAGWQPTRHPDGSTTWTSPRGLTATVRPG